MGKTAIFFYLDFSGNISQPFRLLFILPLEKEWIIAFFFCALPETSEAKINSSVNSPLLFTEKEISIFLQNIFSHTIDWFSLWLPAIEDE